MRSRGKGGFTDEEIFRLKEIVLKLKQELKNEKSGTM